MITIKDILFWAAIGLLILLGVLLMSCAGDNVRISYGIPTCIKSIKHIDNNDTYRMLSISEQQGNWETNLNYNSYYVNRDKFSTFSFGVKYHLTKQIGWFIIDGGIGLRLTEKDKRNAWLAHSNILGDLSLSTGIKKDFESFSLECLYSLEHLSVPFRHDKGLNYDMVSFGVIIPF